MTRRKVKGTKVRRIAAGVYEIRRGRRLFEVTDQPGDVWRMVELDEDGDEISATADTYDTLREAKESVTREVPA